MSPLRGVFEIAIPVSRLSRAEAFYCDVLGLESGYRDERRPWHFLWVGDREGMVVLQETRESFAPNPSRFASPAPSIEPGAR